MGLGLEVPSQTFRLNTNFFVHTCFSPFTWVFRYKCILHGWEAARYPRLFTAFTLARLALFVISKGDTVLCIMEPGILYGLLAFSAERCRLKWRGR